MLLNNSKKEFEEVLNEKKGLPPALYHDLSKSLIIDYIWLIYNLAKWLEIVGGTSEKNAINYVKKYFNVGRNNDFDKNMDFYNRMLIGCIFNEIYRLINMKINSGGCTQSAYSTISVYRGYDGDYLVRGVPFRVYKLLEYFPDFDIDFFDRSEFIQVAFGNKYAMRHFAQNEKKFVFGF